VREPVLPSTAVTSPHLRARVLGTPCSGVLTPLSAA
jgi:hypothetical protein